MELAGYHNPFDQSPTAAIAERQSACPVDSVPCFTSSSDFSALVFKVAKCMLHAHFVLCHTAGSKSNQARPSDTEANLVYLILLSKGESSTPLRSM